MSIRNEKYEWTKEAYEITAVIRKALRPIFEDYKSQFSFEDIHYLVCTEIQEIILDEVLTCRSHIKE